MSEPTLEEKYAWLCNKFRVHDVDTWEGDALLSPKIATGVCFQFSTDTEFPITIDRAIILSMQDEATNLRSKQ